MSTCNDKHVDLYLNLIVFVVQNKNGAKSGANQQQQQGRTKQALVTTTRTEGKPL